MSWRIWARDLRDGLLVPSAPVLSVALCLNALCLSVIALAVDGDFVVRHAELFAANRADFDVRATARVLSLERHDTARTQVIVLGNSSIGATFSEVELEQRLRASFRHGFDISALPTGKQSILEAGAMLEHVPHGARGVAVLGLTPGMMTLEPEQISSDGGVSRYGFRSELYDRTMRAAGIAVPPQAGHYAFDNAAFLSVRFPRLILNLLTGRRVVFTEGGFAGGQGRSIAIDMQARLIGELAPLYAGRAPESFALLGEVHRRLTERSQMRLVLLMPPVNHAFVARSPALRALYAEHDTAVRDYAARRGIALLIASDAVPVDPEDFADGIHLKDGAAVSRHTAWLAQHIEHLAPKESK